MAAGVGRALPGVPAVLPDVRDTLADGRPMSEPGELEAEGWAELFAWFASCLGLGDEPDEPHGE